MVAGVYVSHTDLWLGKPRIIEDFLARAAAAPLLLYTVERVYPAMLALTSSLSPVTPPWQPRPRRRRRAGLWSGSSLKEESH